MTKVIATMLVFFGLVSPSIAQLTLQVPYDKANFHWDAPQDPPPASTGVTRWYVINCGGTGIRVDVPATSYPVKDAVPGPGTYTCTIVAVNNFGASAPVNFPTFEAGFIPGSVPNPRIEIQ